MAAIDITVKTTQGGRYEMQIPDTSETVADFKKRLAPVCGIEAGRQRLVFRGIILKDHFTFDDVKDKHGLQSGQSIHVVSVKPPASATSNSTPNAATANSANSNSSAATPPSPNASNTPSQAPMPNPFASAFGGGAFGAGGGGGGGGMPDMMEIQQQLMRNPEQMQAMLNSPAFESIMNNPEIMRSIMMANPQLRQMMERNPEVAHVFNDPATFRQMMQMARNPSLMSEMMRNTDRQMANIEMMPGGFDALRRMHENIQAPLMDAAQTGFTAPNANAGTNNNDTNNTNGNGNTATANSSNPFSSLFQQQNQQRNTPSNTPMPNPWAANNTATGNGMGGMGGGPSIPAGTANPLQSLFPGFDDTPRSNSANAINNNGAGGGFGAGPFGAGGPSPEAMMDLLDNPGMQQAMQHMLRDPEMLRTMMEANPQTQQLLRDQPQLGAMLQSPEMLSAMLNPEVLRAMRQLQTALGQTGLAGNAPGGMGAGGAAPGAGAGTESAARGGFDAAQNGAQNANTNNGNWQAPGAGRMDFMQQMLNAMGGGARSGGDNAAPAPAAEPSQEELLEMYRTQLGQLRDMGFLDEAMCLQALRQSRGDVNLAIENLLNRFGG